MTPEMFQINTQLCLLRYAQQGQITGIGKIKLRGTGIFERRFSLWIVRKDQRFRQPVGVPAKENPYYSPAGNETPTMPVKPEPVRTPQFVI